MKEFVLASPLRGGYWEAVFALQLPTEVDPQKHLEVDQLLKMKDKMLSHEKIPPKAVTALFEVLIYWSLAASSNEDKAKLWKDWDALKKDNTVVSSTEEITCKNTKYSVWYIHCFYREWSRNHPGTGKPYKDIDYDSMNSSLIDLTYPDSPRAMRDRIPMPPPEVPMYQMSITLSGTAYGSASYSERIVEHQALDISEEDINNLVQEIAEDTNIDVENEIDLVDAIRDRMDEILSDSNVYYNGDWEGYDTEYDDHDVSETNVDDTEIDTDDPLWSQLLDRVSTMCQEQRAELVGEE